MNEATAKVLPEFDEMDEPHYKDLKGEPFSFSPSIRPCFDNDDNMYFTLEEARQLDKGH